MITKHKYSIHVTTKQEFLSVLKQRLVNKSDATYRIIYEVNSNIKIDSLCISTDCRIKLISKKGEICINNLIIKDSAWGNIKFDCNKLEIGCIDAGEGMENKFELLMNYDRLNFINIDIPISHRENASTGKLKTLLSYMNSVIPVDSDANIKLGAEMRMCINDLTALIGGQSAIDMCSSFIIPSTELPVNENNEIVLFKKCTIKNGQKNVIVKLVVPVTQDTRIIMLRSPDGYSNKLRVNRAVVSKIYDIDTDTKTVKASTRKQAHSLYSHKFLYVLGKTVSPVYAFDSSISHQCVSGIHGFLNIKSALDYI